MALILDTGVVYASMDRDDAWHAASRSLIEGAEEMLILPSPTLPELDYLLHQRVGPGACVALIDDIRAEAYVVEELTFEDYSRVRALLDQYGVGFVDAAVLTITERLGETKLATTDHRHFGMMRPRHTDALELVPGQR